VTLTSKDDKIVTSAFKVDILKKTSGARKPLKSLPSLRMIVKYMQGTFQSVAGFPPAGRQNAHKGASLGLNVFAKESIQRPHG
jgi:hypothetical protein